MAIESVFYNPEPNGNHATPSAAIESVAELLRETVLRLQPSAQEISEAWSDAQVTMQQLRVMTILFHNGPTRVSDLARQLQVSTPTVTGILDRLVRQRVTYRMNDARDRRVVLNNLTEAGRELVEQAMSSTDDRAIIAIARLSAEDRSSLEECLTSLLRVIPRTHLR
ncbi:MAG TPA: MarR family transcriptional regulator [Thermomicrobiales bacterium]|nr:MarR family transcriptional regulator [Thermomicrobiales bacterium]